MGFNIKLEMDKRQKNNLMTLLTLIVVLGQFILWIMLLLLDKVGETKEFHTYSDIFIYRCSKCGKIKLKYRIILRYDNEFIPVVKNIIADFNLTNNIKS